MWQQAWVLGPEQSLGLAKRFRRGLGGFLDASGKPRVPGEIDLMGQQRRRRPLRLP